MAHSSSHRLFGPRFGGCVLVLLLLLLLFLVGFTVRLWHSGEASNALASCPSCDCDCYSDIFSIPLDCAKNGTEVNEEMGKDAISFLTEELSLQKEVANDSLRHTKALITGAKKTYSHYQKEAEKCNAGMETCEEAREKAEAGLVEELKLSALWEKRAYELGWKDERRVYQ